ncbi:hypothetical protein AAFP30_24175 [Gordonia sp. CPCC 205515]|uniref:hypothetical protein n=1 Tax=Gordonia sp. CPCC 205515 TaxID=3140791 RepID=UPI003AF37B9B
MPWRVRSDDGGFAPTAYRPSYSGSGTPEPAVVSPAQHRWWADVLRVGGFALGGYLIGVAALLLSGAATDTASVAAWGVRSAVLTVIALAALSVSARRSPTAVGRRELVAVSLMVGGAVVFTGMEIDMHLLHLYHVHSEPLHMAVHGGIVSAIVAGAALLTLPRRVAKGTALVE